MCRTVRVRAAPGRRRRCRSTTRATWCKAWLARVQSRLCGGRGRAGAHAAGLADQAQLRPALSGHHALGGHAVGERGAAAQADGRQQRAQHAQPAGDDAQPPDVLLQAGLADKPGRDRVLSRRGREALAARHRRIRSRKRPALPRTAAACGQLHPSNCRVAGLLVSNVHTTCDAFAPHTLSAMLLSP